jgi:hypothetical protein
MQPVLAVSRLADGKIAPDGRLLPALPERIDLLSPSTSAHEVHGLIQAAVKLSWERSLLATAHRRDLDSGRVGCHNHFRRIHLLDRAHEVHGAIRGKWSSLGWERSFLGYPLTETTRRMAWAAKPLSGRIRLLDSRVNGAIRGKCRAWAGAASRLPTTDEMHDAGWRAAETTFRAAPSTGLRAPARTVHGDPWTMVESGMERSFGWPDKR